MWFLYALISATLNGIGPVLLRKGKVSLTPLGDNIVALVIVLTIVAPLMLLSGINPSKFATAFPYALAVAFLYATYYYVIDKGKVSLTVTLLSGYPIVTVLLSIFLLKESPSSLQFLAIAVIIAGVLLVSLSDKKDSYIRIRSKSWIWWGLFGALMIGFAEFITELATLQVDGNTFTFIMNLSYGPAIAVCFLIDKKGRVLPKLRFKDFLLTVIGVAAIELNLIFYNLAYAHGPASLVSPVSAGRVVITALLAALILKEKTTIFQRAGILLVILGIVVIGLT